MAFSYGQSILNCFEVGSFKCTRFFKKSILNKSTNEKEKEMKIVAKNKLDKNIYDKIAKGATSIELHLEEDFI